MLSYSQSPSRIIAIHPFLDFSPSPTTEEEPHRGAFVTGHSRQKVGNLAEPEKKTGKGILYERVRLRAQARTGGLNRALN